MRLLVMNKLSMQYFWLLWTIILFCESRSFADNRPFAIIYNSEISKDTLKNFNLLVMDDTTLPLIETINQSDVTTLGYLNLGEIEKSRKYFSKVLDLGILLSENPNWPSEYAIDIRSLKWAEFVIEDLIPLLLFKRFDGLFIDTLDTPLELERQNPSQFSGMRESAISLIKAIRINYPDVPIMVNRAYEILPEIGGLINMVLAESLFTSYDFSKKEYRKENEEEIKRQIDFLKNLKKLFPHLTIYTLDYWNSSDSQGIKAIYERSEKEGFIPYVADIDLMKIQEKP
ncbi:endo alpha-1,4 polygalactosaminidase [Criblamydia sequanensis]|uniref:Glycoside-hydrolase family GH114 TIM-barrel domain-containing protein n=1 Tax=Candidatus Criblamydia sequanensis CRIB-18 TaxID=1437425 RepID=A0A090CZA7_9BACT|nr:endo alpha-1,4 polygalactosaminidase [Criblamydia sequanensis]CDR34307.1 Conserved hypothetical protein [Criblamydia sequanensis CRIB-18]